MTPLHCTIAVGGIDTDVGKSFVTGLFARWLVQQGRNATTLKLVQTGCQPCAGPVRRLAQSDFTPTTGPIFADSLS